MCRNGRYFVLLTIKDKSGKEKNYMKQVVLINSVFSKEASAPVINESNSSNTEGKVSSIPWKLTIIVILLSSFCFGQETAAQSKIRIGVLNLMVTGADENFASAINGDVVQIVSDMGFYKVYGQIDLENSYKQIKQKFPSHCTDPRCVVEIGSSLGLTG